MAARTVHLTIARAARASAVLTLAMSVMMVSPDARADPHLDWAGGNSSDDIAATLSATLEVASDLRQAIGSSPGGAPSAREGSTWSWPLVRPQVPLKPFDAPSQRWLPGHRGVDLAGFEGTPVRTVANGVVSYSGEINGVGIVSVLHPDGILSTYQPVLDPPASGSSVRRGQRLGTLGAEGSHCWPLNCLHLGARIGQDYIDPMLLLRAWEVSLLPNG
ncbi:MAG: M23 family metallopeptidase [Ornithinimicrobium sp.]